MSKVCVIIPCFNEVSRLDSATFLAYLSTRDSIDLCFVNDGSTDKTLELLNKIQAQEPGRIHVINLGENGGKAEAVRQGCLACAGKEKYEWLGYWDADLATPLSEINHLVKKREEAGSDIIFVLGSRVKRLGAEVDRNGKRHIFGRVFSTFASLILKLPVYDSQCGAKLIKASEVNIAFNEPFLSKWLFDVEILARFRNHYGLKPVLSKIIEVPLLQWKEIGGSKIKASYFFKVPLELWRIARRYN
jgi:dolichyl-phosphate beta-glucosyltransferase